MDDDAKFCPGCGTGVTGASPAQASRPAGVAKTGQPLLVVKPVLVPRLAVLESGCAGLFMAVWGGGFLGVFSYLLLVKFLELGIPAWLPPTFFGALFLFGIPFLSYSLQRKAYAKTEYRFYPDHLDYYEGFWTVEEKTMGYRNITEVNLRKGILQKKYGLGTLILSTPATGGTGAARSGIRMKNIPHVDEVYQKIKGLVQGSSR